MSDLAGDAVALLDHLGLESAHLVGVSMGGMIAQTVAVEHPTRVRSLTSISSTTGRRSVGWQHPSLLPRLIGPRKAGRDAYVDNSVAMWALIGSAAYPSDPEALRTRAGETFDRGVSASGVVRQMLAILTQGDRTPRLRSLRIPALVIHGNADKMVHVSRRALDRRRHPRSRAGHHRRHGPRPAARALRHLRRGDPAYGRPGLVAARRS